MTGSKSQGGSTITMQVARNFFLSNEKTYLRKLNEIILSLEMEQILTKEEILTLYLNKIYLGNRAYGIGAAANVYYGRPIGELTLAEMAMIAGLPKAPSRFNPIANPDRALIRRNYVLRRMWEVGYINEQDFHDAIQAPLSAQFHRRSVEVYAPYVAETVRSTILEEYGEAAYSQGLSVYTTIRGDHQAASNDAIQKALLEYDHRHGYRGPISSIELVGDETEMQLNELLKEYSSIGPLETALVLSTESDIAQIYVQSFGYASLKLEDLKWAREKLSTNSRGPAPKKITDVLNAGDIIRVENTFSEQWQLAQLPEAQGAIIAVAPHDGAVTAMNGGFDYFNNKFNRVTQSKRQPGSGFKPFIYSAALEKGYTAASIINDAPVVFDDPGLENVWRPENYSGKFFGPTRLRKGLIHSRNLISIRLLRDIGPQYAVDYAKKFGFEDGSLHGNLSLALGSGSAAPWDMARAYAALANGGYRVEPYIIQRIESATGEILFQANPATVCETCLQTSNAPETKRVSNLDTNQLEQTDDPVSLPEFNVAERIMTPQNNYIMNSMLRDVVKLGTGRKALQLGRSDLAGKTGTTNDQVDAWFNGFHPELVAVSWVGFDTPKTLGRYETGGRAALPMWIHFMREALKGLPESPLALPTGMTTVRIDPETGLLAAPGSTNAIYETFRAEHVPQEMTNDAYSFDGHSEDVPIDTIELF
jgi:penicillin-binding protein 1A